MICHALRDLATTGPNRPHFLLHGRKVQAGKLLFTSWRQVPFSMFDKGLTARHSSCPVCPFSYHMEEESPNRRVPFSMVWERGWTARHSSCPVSPFSYHMEEESPRQIYTLYQLMTSTFTHLSSSWRVDRETQFLSSMPFVVGKTGFSWSKPLMYLSWQTWTDLGWI